MKRNALMIVLTAGAIGTLLHLRVEAQSGGAYSLRSTNIAGGGQGFATGGPYVLHGSSGQADAGQSTGGSYTMRGGFWTSHSTPTVDVPDAELTPIAFGMRAPAPNPFRSSTTVAFDLPRAVSVELVIHGVDGRAVRTLVTGPSDAGRHRAIWDGRDDRGRVVAAGIYFARLAAGEFKSTRRIVRFQ